MEKMWDWYYVPPRHPGALRLTSTADASSRRRPFEGDDEDEALLSPSAKRVKFAWNTIVKTKDPVLFDHLQVPFNIISSHFTFSSVYLSINIR